MQQHEQAMAILAAIGSTEIRFHDDAPELLARFKATGREIAFDEAGKPTTTYDGQTVALADALTRWATDDRTIADGRTLPRTDTGKGRPGMASKQDYATVAEKTAFISEHGIAAWESLPTKPPVTSEVVFKEDFFKLNLSEKTRRLNENPNAIAELPNRPKPLAKVNQAGIDAQRSKYRAELEEQQRKDFGIAA